MRNVGAGFNTSKVSKLSNDRVCFLPSCNTVSRQWIGLSLRKASKTRVSSSFCTFNQQALVVPRTDASLFLFLCSFQSLLETTARSQLRWLCHVVVDLKNCALMFR